MCIFLRPDSVPKYAQNREILGVKYPEISRQTQVLALYSLRFG